jgi:hypothetical protein
MAPAVLVVTATWGSPVSLTLSLLLSNQIQPAVLGVKTLPLTVIPVPGAPVVGLTAILGTESTVKIDESSIGAPEGISTRME